MAIKVIAQRREVKLGKNPGMKFVMRPDLYIPQILLLLHEIANAMGKVLTLKQILKRENDFFHFFVRYSNKVYIFAVNTFIKNHQRYEKANLFNVGTALCRIYIHKLQ